MQLLVALLVGGALLIAIALRFGSDPDAFVAMFATAVLVVLSLEDLRRRIIPNRIVLPAWALALTLNITLHPDRWWTWLLASFGTAAVFLVFSRATDGGIGMGDVKLVGFLGAALGRDVVLALVIGSATAAIVSAAILIRHGTEARKRTIPYGPFLALGAIATFLINGP
jgi:prepilin signal peptidase PulO-like enzyme (type II secretory pathway)